MNLRKTLVLLGVLLAAIVYLKGVSLPAAKKRLDGGKAFDALSAETLASISFARAGSNGEKKLEQFQLVKDAGAGVMPKAAESRPESSSTESLDGDETGEQSSNTTALKDWGIISLKGAPLDSSALSGIVATLRDLSLGEEIERSELEKDLSVYGLINPELTLTVTEIGKKPIEVSFGAKNDYLGRRYVKVSGRSGIFMADDIAFTTLNKGTPDLRDKTPIRFLDPDVREIKMESGAERFTLIQKTVGEWEVSGEKSYKASTVAVADLLRAAKDLRVAEFLDTEAANDKNGLAKPKTKMSIHFREGVSPSTLDVMVSSVPSKEDPKENTIYFTYSGAPSVLLTLGDPFSRLAVSIDGLRDKTIFGLASNEIGKVVVSGEDYATVELSSSDGIDWKVNGKNADPVFTEDVLSNLIALKVDSYIYDGSVKSIDRVSRRFEVFRKGTVSDKTVLLVGSKVGDAWICQVEGRDGFFRVQEAELRKASPREETLLAATPTPISTPASTPVPAGK